MCLRRKLEVVEIFPPILEKYKRIEIRGKGKLHLLVVDC